MYGEFVVKNLVLLAAGIVVATHRPAPPTDRHLGLALAEFTKEAETASGIDQGVIGADPR
ncbi:hypothetical protein ABT126_38485 [Streptomyces sp. NPDC002012]|uniref:hypothetical protein n=1 Tax=unclassified Streptomyces TaxID=2593676 RepID=UPI0033321F13